MLQAELNITRASQAAREDAEEWRRSLAVAVGAVDLMPSDYRPPVYSGVLGGNSTAEAAAADHRAASQVDRLHKSRVE